MVAANCNADNCRRALRQSNVLASAQAFCKTFTTASVTATTALPSYAVSGYTGNVASCISSACTCIATSSSSISPTVESGL
jgi:polygalacturonase